MVWDDGSRALRILQALPTGDHAAQHVLDVRAVSNRPVLPRYPCLPVLKCRGYEPGAGEPEANLP
jgi:hypothetical protein